MYIIKNALTSITRNKGRNLLIGIIVMVISCSVAVTLAINNSSKKLIDSYQSKYEVEATIGMNRDNMMKDFNPEDAESSKEDMKEMFNSANNISEDDIKKYADSKYVKSYYYTISAGVNIDGVEKAEVSSNNMGGPGGGPGEQQESSTDFTIKGYSSIDSMNEFIEGSYKITDGEVSTDFDDNSCLINSELATLNSLNVGDTITVIDPNDESKTYELKISGIFEEESSDDNKMDMFSNSANTIITNSNFVKNMNTQNSDLSIQIKPTFILKNKDVIEKFSKELTKKGLNENLTVETNLDQVSSATSTISNVKTFSTTFLIITLIIGTIVLLIINMINIRERKYEIGVLRTIGMKKSKVCLQFICELLIVSFVALLVGAGLGAVMSVPVSNSLLESEISSSQEENNNIKENFGRGPGQEQNNSNSENSSDNESSTSDDSSSKPNMDFGGNGFKGVASIQAFDSIDATVDIKVLLELLGIGLAITLVSSISAVTSIQKFSPLTILKERS